MNGKAILGVVLWVAMGLGTIGYCATKHERLREKMQNDNYVLIVAILAWPILIGAEIAIGGAS